MFQAQSIAASLAAALVLVGVANFADGSQAQEPTRKQQERKPPARTWQAELGQLAPDFELVDTAGESWKLSEQRGKLVVLEWYNPLCPVVQKAHSAGSSLEKLGNSSNESGIVWVAINSGAPGAQGHGAQLNDESRQRMGMNYPVLLDESGWVGRMYEATNTPHLFIIDKHGKLAYRGGHEGKDGAPLVQQALDELSADKSVSNPSTKAVGCAVKYERSAKLGLVAPNFSLPEFSGDRHTLADLRGSYVVLEWFNPGCPVVKKAHGSGGALESCASRQAQQGVKWLAINSGSPGKQGTGEAENAAAQQRWGMAHPILVDSDGKVGRLYGAKTTPQMVLLDPRGVIVYAGAHQDRSGELNYIDQALAELSAGKPVSVPQTRSFGCGVKY